MIASHDWRLEMVVAWEDFEGANGTGWTGDKPNDEFALALGRIAAAYAQEFDRKPTIEELCHSLENVIGADPAAYVSNPLALETGRLVFERP